MSSPQDSTLWVAARGDGEVPDDDAELHHRAEHADDAAVEEHEHARRRARRPRPGSRGLAAPRRDAPRELLVAELPADLLQVRPGAAPLEVGDAPPRAGRRAAASPGAGRTAPPRGPPQALHEAGRARQRRDRARAGSSGMDSRCPKRDSTADGRLGSPAGDARDSRPPRRRRAPASRGWRTAGRRTSRARRPRRGRCRGGGPSRRRARRTPPAPGPCPASRSRPARRPGWSLKRSGGRRPGRRRPRTPPSARRRCRARRRRAPASENWASRSAVDAGARLVAGVQVVAERLDDVVEGAGDVRHARRRDAAAKRLLQQADAWRRPRGRRGPAFGGAPKWLRKSS